MNSYDDFIQEVVNLVEKKTGITPQIREVTKNNGVKLKAIIIPNEEINITPSLYLESFYEEYLGEKNMEEIVRDILNDYEKHSVNQNFDVNSFMNFDLVKNRIIYKMINAEENEDLLKEVPHQRVLDLAKVYLYLFDSDSDYGRASILIHNVHLECWKITEDKLFEVAEQNTPEIMQCKCEDLDQLIKEIVGDRMEIDEFPKHMPMLVLTNQTKLFGASCMFYEDILKNIAEEKGGNLFILPSSIHETIILPDNDFEVSLLKEMVKEVNDTQLDREEILSYNVYFYNRNDNELLIAK